MILLPYTLMDILSLFTRCCGYRWYCVPYWRTDYFCCPGWKQSTYQNCDVGKKIDIKEGKVRLWVVKVTSTNITAISWRSVLLGVIHRSTQREPLEYPERTTSIDSGVSRENHWHWHQIKKQFAWAPIFRCRNWNIHLYISSQCHLFTCSTINDSEINLLWFTLDCRNILQIYAFKFIYIYSTLLVSIMTYFLALHQNHCMFLCKKIALHTEVI
jgi:hypothetical protein